MHYNFDDIIACQSDFDNYLHIIVTNFQKKQDIVTFEFNVVMHFD